MSQNPAQHQYINSSNSLANQVFTSNGTTSAWVSASNIYPNNDIMHGLEERIEAIEARLLILLPDHELHEKYPALKEAYDSYKVIARMVGSKK
jgi:hypothetical protein